MSTFTTGSKTAFVACLLVGCASKPEPIPPPGPAPAPDVSEPEVVPPAEPPTLPPPVASSEHFANASQVVENTIAHAHGVLRTSSSFVAPAEVEVALGTTGRDGTTVLFAVNDEVLGTFDTDRGCGSDVLRLPWRRAGDGSTRTEIQSTPQWWRVGEGVVRVGAAELVGVAKHASADCDVWGVLVTGAPRLDVEYKDPGSSGPTEGMQVELFGGEDSLVATAAGVTFGADPPMVEMIPTFEASCVHVRWASDLLGTQTFRVRFSNGPQEDGCPAGDTVEEFVEARGPGGEVARTERSRRDPAGTDRDDYVARNIGAGRLTWRATTRTQTLAEDDCETFVEETVGQWALKHPTKPEHSAVGRRTRTESTCSPPTQADPDAAR